MIVFIILQDTVHVISKHGPHLPSALELVQDLVKKLDGTYAVMVTIGTAVAVWWKRIRRWLSKFKSWMHQRIKGYLIKHILKVDPEILHAKLLDNETLLKGGFSSINVSLSQNRQHADEQYAEIAGLLRAHDSRLSRMEKEILPNGGEHSMSDMLTRLVVDSRLSKNISEYGQFEANKKGEFIFVNDAYCKITGYTREDLLRLGYINTIYEPQREDVRKGIDSAIVDKRKLEIDYDVQRKDGGLVHVIHRWQPMKKSEKDDDVFGYSGTLNIL